MSNNSELAGSQPQVCEEGKILQLTYGSWRVVTQAGANPGLLHNDQVIQLMYRALHAAESQTAALHQNGKTLLIGIGTRR